MPSTLSPKAKLEIEERFGCKSLTDQISALGSKVLRKRLRRGRRLNIL